MSKHKEPAGLRRWRLAHRKKPRKTRVRVLARRHRRYGRVRRGGRRSKAGIPIVQAVTLFYPTANAIRSTGFSETTMRDAIYQTTGISLLAGNGGPPHDFKKGAVMAITLLAESTIGKKIANRTGANRWIKKATGNMLQLM